MQATSDWSAERCEKCQLALRPSQQVLTLLELLVVGRSSADLEPQAMASPPGALAWAYLRHLKDPAGWPW